MAKICYRKIRLNPDKLAIIENANEFIEEYVAAGYRPTLRQIYYRFIATDLFPVSWIDTEYNLKHHLDPNTKNTIKNYKKLGDIIGDGRMAGLVDWHAIEDITRGLDEVPHWETPAAIMASVARSFSMDKWVGQKYRPQVWVEKDALIGIVKKAAHALDVPAFSCRGYGSLSSLWEAAQLMRQHMVDGYQPVILHLGDHDPSGLDMSRDIQKRLNHFLICDYAREVVIPRMRVNGDAITTDAVVNRVRPEMIEDCGADEIVIDRIALTMAQVEQYNLPPNPAKETDARFKKYQDEHGDDSWELDALPLQVLVDLITSGIHRYLDPKKYNAIHATETKHLETLAKAAHHWDSGLAATVAKLKSPPKPKPVKPKKVYSEEELMKMGLKALKTVMKNKRKGKGHGKRKGK